MNYRSVSNHQGKKVTYRSVSNHQGKKVTFYLRCFLCFFLKKWKALLILLGVKKVLI